MIECAISAEPGVNVPYEVWDSNPARDIRASLRSEGLIGDNNKATDKGRAWVKFICQVPIPVQQWVLPEIAND